jgi:hypothetical protein
MKNGLTLQHHHTWHLLTEWRHAVRIVEFRLRGFLNVLRIKVSKQVILFAAV